MAYTCGDYEYELLPDGTAEIVYKGDAPHVVVPGELDGHAVSSVRYYGFNWIETLESVVLPEGIKKIGNFAFHHCDHLIRVDIPQSVEQFGNNVFDSCESLTGVRLPDGIKRIERNMFFCCGGLKEIRIPETVTEIEDSAFYFCSSLEKMVIPTGVTEIGRMAFAHCSRLKRIEIPASVCSIGEYAFSGCSMLTISAQRDSAAWEYAVGNNIPTEDFVSGSFRCCLEPDGTVAIMRYLGEEAEVTVPMVICGRAVSTIRNDAFEMNKKLRRVNLPNGLKRIGRGAFLWCEALGAVRIPASVKKIEAGAFLACHALGALEIAPENEAYTVFQGALYTKDMKTLVAWPQARGHVCVADGVETIGQEAFSLCRGLRSVKVPKSLKSIGMFAFNWCGALDDLEFPPGLESIEGFAFQQCKKALQEKAEKWMANRKLEAEESREDDGNEAEEESDREFLALEAIRKEMQHIPGHTGFYYKNLVSGFEYGVREEETFGAASVIKLPLFLHILKEAAEGRLSMEERLSVTGEDKVPICGALTLFTGDVTCDVRTLCRLMISISDNTATNRLIDYATIEGAAEGFEKMGLEKTKLTRKLFDREASKKGLRNVICPKEMGMLLEMLYREEYFRPEDCKEAIDTLLLQQVDHKLNGKICGEVSIAHKTGEDDELSNDVGIVYAKEPFIICFAGHDTDVYVWEDLMRRGTYELLRAQDEQ